jgi:hypothetical protein
MKRTATVVLCTLAAGLLAATPALAAGKPHPTYPERQEVPADTAERDAKCVTLRERTQRLGDTMANPNSLLARLDIVRVYHRSSERYLEEQCGDVDANGYALSHRTERSGIVKGSPAPEDGHHGGGHAAPAHAEPGHGAAADGAHHEG